MATIFAHKRIVPAWLAAAKQLNVAVHRTAANYVLEITNPTCLVKEDLAIIRAVDVKLRKFTSDMTLDTVAGTIFPNHLYKKFGRPAFYEHYLSAIARGRKRNSWGTYAQRMMKRIDRKNGETFNPLDRIVKKFIAAKKRAYQAVYELGVVEADDVLADGPWCELPIADPAAKPCRNIPCLSHLSFKLNDGHVALTAVYRSHYYAQRALGNLIGLSQLQSFVAAESKLPIGSLTCVSTLAVLDAATWGGVRATSDFLNSLPTT